MQKSIGVTAGRGHGGRGKGLGAFGRQVGISSCGEVTSPSFAVPSLPPGVWKLLV